MGVRPTSHGRIVLDHGVGGRLTRDLIRDAFLPKLNNPYLKELADSAIISYRTRLAFTTDSFVVSPLVFPGGDIGKLSVCGTVNDLVMVGARPEYISLALILEEGLERTILEKIVDSIAKIAKVSGVFIVTGDLKVVERGACDKIFITTSGIGRIITRRRLSVRNIKPGDRIIITGGIAEHGLAVLAGRQDLSLGLNIKSDCAALNRLLIPILGRTDAIRFMRDPTRGGLAATLNEIAEGSGCGISINEKQIPVAGKVRAACELLGIDPLHMANEGKAVLIVRKQNTDKLLVGLRKHPLGRLAREIGTVTKAHPGQVVLKTVIGTERIVDMLTGEPLPRIC